MEEIHVLMSMIGGLGIFMMYLHQGVMKRFELSDHRTDQRFDKLDEKVTDIDRRLCRLEGAFASKDCCMIKDHQRKSEVV